MVGVSSQRVVLTHLCRCSVSIEVRWLRLSHVIALVYLFLMDALADQTTPVACVVEDCLEL